MNYFKILLLFFFCSILFTNCKESKPTVEKGKNQNKTEQSTVGSSYSNRILESNPKPKFLMPKDALFGYLVYAADAAVFYDCNSNERYNVLQQEGYFELEKAYIGKRTKDFEQIYAILQGQIYQRANTDTNKTEKVLLVKKLIELNPDKNCTN